MKIGGNDPCPCGSGMKYEKWRRLEEQFILPGRFSARLPRSPLPGAADGRLPSPETVVRKCYSLRCLDRFACFMVRRKYTDRLSVSLKSSKLESCRSWIRWLCFISKESRCLRKWGALVSSDQAIRFAPMKRER